MPNTLVVLAGLAFVAWLARTDTRETGPAGEVNRRTLIMFASMVGGAGIGLAGSVTIWLLAGRPTEGCSGCEAFWAPLHVVAAIIGLALGFVAGKWVVTRSARLR